MIWAFATGAALGFGAADVPIGTEVDSVHQTELNLDLEVELNGQRLERTIARTHRQVSTIQRTASGFEVEWTENRHRALEPGYEHDRSLPVIGHRYRVVDGQVRRADGAEVSVDEAQIVTQVDLFSLLSSLREMLGAAPQAGSSVPAGSMFAGLLADAPGDPEVIGGTVTVKEIAGSPGEEVAVLELDLQLRSEGVDSRNVRVRTQLHGIGTARMDVSTGWTQEFIVAGTVWVVGTRPGLQTRGTGTFRTDTRLVFRTP